VEVVEAVLGWVVIAGPAVPLFALLAYCVRNRPVARSLFAAALGLVLGGSLAGLGTYYGYLRFVADTGDAIFAAFGFGVVAVGWGGAAGGWIAVTVARRRLVRGKRASGARE
jgi:hypothetical protein